MDFLMTMLKIDNPNDRVECGFPNDKVKCGFSDDGVNFLDFLMKGLNVRFLMQG
jgi:hypothetical protein